MRTNSSYVLIGIPLVWANRSRLNHVAISEHVGPTIGFAHIFITFSSHFRPNLAYPRRVVPVRPTRESLRGIACR